MPRSAVDLERPAERAEHVDRVAGSKAGEPFGPAPDRPVMDRDGAGRGVGRVDREGSPEDEARQVAGANVDELAGPRPGGEIRRVERLKPLTREDLPAVDQLG